MEDERTERTGRVSEIDDESITLTVHNARFEMSTLNEIIRTFLDLPPVRRKMCDNHVTINVSSLSRHRAIACSLRRIFYSTVETICPFHKFI